MRSVESLCSNSIASRKFQAPEIGIYNDNFGWGVGIEQMGVSPDIEVDNNPRTTYDGRDTQLFLRRSFSPVVGSVTEA